jgi:hypothetical protein
MAWNSYTLWSGLATANANTYKSPTITPEDRRTYLQVSFTGGAVAGTLTLETNTLPEYDYNRAVAAAGSEAANTTGWVAQDLRSGGENPQLSAATLVVAAAGNHVFQYPAGAYRLRLSFAATATGAVSAYKRHVKV